MESSLCEKPERHASRRLSDHLTFEGQKQKVHSLVDKVTLSHCAKTSTAAAAIVSRARALGFNRTDPARD